MIRSAVRTHLPAMLPLLLLGAAHAQPSAATVTAARTAGVYPAAAAPGETAWIFGLGGVPPEGKLNVGGQTTEYRLDRPSGWLAFQVPQAAAGGPQTLTLRGAPYADNLARASALVTELLAVGRGWGRVVPLG